MSSGIAHDSCQDPKHRCPAGPAASPEMRTESVFMNTRLTFVTCGLALSLTGCLHPTIGPKSIPRDRAAYGSGIGDSWKEQMLLNIVKMRYIDAPTFVGVGNIVVSYTLTQTASAGAQVNTPEGTAPPDQPRRRTWASADCSRTRPRSPTHRCLAARSFRAC
jgi:hypothetical protein